MDSVYLVYAASIKKLAEEDLRKKYEKAKIDHGPKWEYENYINYLKEWGEDEYNINKWISSVHTNKKEAIDYAVENYGDINEAGCYNYTAVMKADCGCTYFETHINPIKDIELFKYNRELDKYEKMNGDEPEYMPFLYNIWGMAYNKDRNTLETLEKRFGDVKIDEER